MIRLSIILLAITAWSPTYSDIVSSPICEKCDCFETDGTTNIRCEKSSQSDIFNAINWNNSTSYGHVSINNGDFTYIDKMFPASSLKLLDLSHNSIGNITQNAFKNLQDMEILILSFNNIGILDPDVFKGTYIEGDLMPLHSLKTLKLDHNEIHSLHQDLFEHVSRLEILDLSHNPLKVIDHHSVVAITSLTQLKVLDISYTQISTLPDNFMHTPLYLETLNLTGNNFQLLPETLSQSHNLKNLYVDNNPIVNVTNEIPFPTISTLRVLHMNYMPHLSAIYGESLSGLSSLEELVISHNAELKYVDKSALTTRRDGAEYETWPPIKKLHLRNNSLTGIDMHFVRWDGLIELDLTHNKFSCDCENQWMINSLVPIYLKIDEEGASDMRCFTPVEMEKFTLYDLYAKKTLMRCIDYYGNRPEKDGMALVGVLAGILIAIPMVLTILYAYRTRCFRVPVNSPKYFPAGLSE